MNSRSHSYERPDQDSKAVLGAAGTLHVSLAPLNQFKRIAADIAARPGCGFNADVIERALAYSFLADRLDVDAVVSSARSAFGPDDKGLLDLGALVTVGEALAMIGANVRQREEVPLGGSPMHVQQRTEVYPLTARVILPNGQEWWSSCLQTRPGQREWLGHAEAVFKRVGQAIRGRDGVHEALRLVAGRSAILDALYHFDVVLTSSVASLDALARVADEIFEISSKPEEIGWQKKKWRRKLHRKVSVVADVVSPDSRLGAALLVLTRMRNSIHSIPLDEYLKVEVDQQSSRAEHRAMISRDLSDSLIELRDALGALDAYGIFIDDTDRPFINVGQLTEQILSWLIEIIGELLGAMLSCDRFRTGTPLPTFPELDQMLHLCKALARVGTYPCRKGRAGMPAAPSVHRRIMGIIHEHRGG